MTKILTSILNNLVSNLTHQVFYVVETADWSIRWDGLSLQQYINNFAVTYTHHGAIGKIVHFGSVNRFIGENDLKGDFGNNRLVLTWFHVVPDDPRVKYIPELNTAVDIVHTANTGTYQTLTEHGLNENKIVVIPLGVDLEVFTPTPDEEKVRLRESLGLSSDKIVIGSFQKDGVGWGEGLEPKLEKGPDIFCEVIEKLSEKYPIHVLLTGPARGYVKKRLDKAGIPYTHRFLEDYPKIVDYYRVLDLYLITSRVEGGPKAILESWATGVPVVSTKVGMVPDIATDGQDVLLAPVEAVDVLVRKSKQLISDAKIRNRLSENGLQKVQGFTWEKTAQRYQHEIYDRFQ